MDRIFKDPKALQRMHEGRLGPYMDSYAADMHQQGYATPTVEAQIRLVADFSRSLAKRRFSLQEITTELFQRYLPCRKRHRRPITPRRCRVHGRLMYPKPLSCGRARLGSTVRSA